MKCSEERTSHPPPETVAAEAQRNQNMDTAPPDRHRGPGNRVDGRFGGRSSELVPVTWQRRATSPDRHCSEGSGNRAFVKVTKSGFARRVAPSGTARRAK